MAKARVPVALRFKPFTLEMATAEGLTRSALRSRPWRKVLRNVWVHESVPHTRALLVMAIRLVLGPSAFICGPTGAWIHGIDVQDPSNTLIWIGSATDSRPRDRPGFRTKRLTLEPGDLTVVDATPVTTATRTAFDCGRWLSLVEAVVVLDALAHDHKIGLADVAARADRAVGVRGVRNLRAALDLADPRSESPMETRLRVLLVTSGLPRPKCQYVVEDATGKLVGRADMAYPDQRVVVEYDGSFHWEQRRADDRRRKAMRDLGWNVIVVSSEDYYQAPSDVVEQVRAALAVGK